MKTTYLRRSTASTWPLPVAQREFWDRVIKRQLGIVDLTSPGIEQTIKFQHEPGK